MKKILSVLVVLVMMLSVCGVSFADDAVDKLGRGLSNVITSPLEIPRGMGHAGEKNGFFAGVTTGLLKGTANFVKRALVGAFEVATFPVPVPEDYAPIIDDPEYILGDQSY
jgi:putative exosortase-associated protein (TIGR04073 family)